MDNLSTFYKNYDKQLSWHYTQAQAPFYIQWGCGAFIEETYVTCSTDERRNVNDIVEDSLDLIGYIIHDNFAFVVSDTRRDILVFEYSCDHIQCFRHTLSSLEYTFIRNTVIDIFKSFNFF